MFQSVKDQFGKEKTEEEINKIAADCKKNLYRWMNAIEKIKPFDYHAVKYFPEAGKPKWNPNHGPKTGNALFKTNISNMINRHENDNNCFFVLAFLYCFCNTFLY